MANGDDNKPNTPEESGAQASAIKMVNAQLAEQQEALAKLVQGSMSHKLGLEQPSQSAGRNVRLIRNLYKNFDKMDQVSDESEQEFIRNNPRYRSVSRNLPFNQR